MYVESGCEADEPCSGENSFISLADEKIAKTAYGSRANISKRSANSIVRQFGVSNAFLLDLVGRPNYWGPYVLNDEDKGVFGTTR